MKDIKFLLETWKSFSEQNKVICEVAKSAVEQGEDKKTFSIPKFRITEKWGEPGNGDRKVLEIFSKQIRGSSLDQKLNSISSFVNNAFEKEMENVSIPEILSHLVFLDSLSSIVFEFNASTAGFLFESFLAALLGGSAAQIPTQGSVSNVADITDREGKPISLKLLKQGIGVKGSINNLKIDLEKFKSNMEYVVAYKMGTSKIGERIEIGKFTIGFKENNPSISIEELELKEGPQFSINYKHASNMARKNPMGTFDLPDREKIIEVAQKYVDQLGKEVTDIFNLLESLSLNINKYLLNSPEAKMNGLRATEEAKSLSKNISKVVKK